MKFALAQLRKFNMPYEFIDEVNFDELIGFENIKNVKESNIKTIINEYNDDTYKLNFDIHVILVLEDSVSFEDIEYEINTKGEEFYSTDNNRDDSFIIEGTTLDTKEAIFELILSEKPMSISNHEFVDEIEDEDLDEEFNNNPFKDLKKLL